MRNKKAVELLGLVLMFITCFAASAGAVDLQDVKVDESAGKATIEIVLSGDASFKQSISQNPAGILVDIRGLKVKDNTLNIGKSIVKFIIESQAAIRPVLVGRIFIETSDVSSLKVDSVKSGNSIIITAMSSSAETQPAAKAVVAEDTKAAAAKAAAEADAKKAAELKASQDAAAAKAKLEADKKAAAEAEAKKAADLKAAQDAAAKAEADKKAAELKASQDAAAKAEADKKAAELKASQDAAAQAKLEADKKAADLKAAQDAAAKAEADKKAAELKASQDAAAKAEADKKAAELKAAQDAAAAKAAAGADVKKAAELKAAQDAAAAKAKLEADKKAADLKAAQMKASEAKPAAAEIKPVASASVPAIPVTAKTKASGPDTMQLRAEKAEAEKAKLTEEVKKEKEARLKAEALIAQLDKRIAELQAELDKKNSSENTLRKLQEESEKKRVVAESSAEKEKQARMKAESAIKDMDARIAELLKEKLESSKPIKVFAGSETMVRLPVQTGADIFFEFGKSDLIPVAKKTLTKIAGIMKVFVENKIRVAGYTDSTGSDTYNIKLSVRRAKAVVKYLTEKEKISKGRITVKGYGSGDPVAPNDTNIGRSQNRRVEVIIINGKELED